MIKVTGSVDYSVHVNCPHCHESIELISDNSSQYDYDSCITKAFLKNNTEGWENMGIELTCHHCDKDFMLDNLEY